MISFPLKSFHFPADAMRTSHRPLFNNSSLKSISPTFSEPIDAPIANCDDIGVDCTPAHSQMHLLSKLLLVAAALFIELITFECSSKD